MGLAQELKSEKGKINPINYVKKDFDTFPNILDF
jgi:hypothetical protein